MAAAVAIALTAAASFLAPKTPGAVATVKGTPRRKYKKAKKDGHPFCFRKREASRLSKVWNEDWG